MQTEVGVPGPKMAPAPMAFSFGTSSSGITPPPNTRMSDLQQLDDPTEVVLVRSAQDADPDRVRVLLDRRLHDLLRRLPQARVDHFHPRVPKRTRHHLRPTVVTVETRLCHDHTHFSLTHGFLRLLPYP